MIEPTDADDEHAAKIAQIRSDLAAARVRATGPIAEAVRYLEERLSVIEAAAAMVEQATAATPTRTAPAEPEASPGLREDQAATLPHVYREQLAVQWPPTQDDPRGPIEADDVSVRADLADARARDVAARYAHEGAHLVRLVTTVHSIP